MIPSRGRGNLTESLMSRIHEGDHHRLVSVAVTRQIPEERD